MGQNNVKVSNHYDRQSRQVANVQVILQRDPDITVPVFAGFVMENRIATATVSYHGLEWRQVEVGQVTFDLDGAAVITELDSKGMVIGTEPVTVDPNKIAEYTFAQGGGILTFDKAMGTLRRAVNGDVLGGFPDKSGRMDPSKENHVLMNGTPMHPGHALAQAFSQKEMPDAAARDAILRNIPEGTVLYAQNAQIVFDPHMTAVVNGREEKGSWRRPREGDLAVYFDLEGDMAKWVGGTKRANVSFARQGEQGKRMPALRYYDADAGIFKNIQKVEHENRFTLGGYLAKWYLTQLTAREQAREEGEAFLPSHMRREKTALANAVADVVMGTASIVAKLSVAAGAGAIYWYNTPTDKADSRSGLMSAACALLAGGMAMRGMTTVAHKAFSTIQEKQTGDIHAEKQTVSVIGVRALGGDIKRVAEGGLAALYSVSGGVNPLKAGFFLPAVGMAAMGITHYAGSFVGGVSAAVSSMAGIIGAAMLTKVGREGHSKYLEEAGNSWKQDKALHKAHDAPFARIIEK